MLIIDNLFLLTYESYESLLNISITCTTIVKIIVMPLVISSLVQHLSVANLLKKINPPHKV